MSNMRCSLYGIDALIKTCSFLCKTPSGFIFLLHSKDPGWRFALPWADEYYPLQGKKSSKWLC